MPLSTDTLNNMNAIGKTGARRLDGLAIYPPFPYTLMRNATLTMARALIEEDKYELLFQALADYERIGVFIHPRSAEFLLVMVDVYEGASSRPMLRRTNRSDKRTEDPTVKLARMLDEAPSELRNPDSAELDYDWDSAPRA
jgi:hypothetical protein